MPENSTPGVQPTPAASSGGSSKGAGVIGKVDAVQGDAWIIRDGHKVEAVKDAPLLEGDQVETAAQSQISLVFADRSTFVLKDRGMIALDDFAFDADSKAGHESILIAKGAFAFVSGDIAKAHPEAARLATPVMSIGVRGTTVAGQVGADGSTSVALQPDPGSSFVGELVLAPLGGGEAIVINTAGSGILGATTGGGWSVSADAGVTVSSFAPVAATPPSIAPALPSAPADTGGTGGDGGNTGDAGGGDTGTGTGGGDGGTGGETVVVVVTTPPLPQPPPVTTSEPTPPVTTPEPTPPATTTEPPPATTTEPATPTNMAPVVETLSLGTIAEDSFFTVTADQLLAAASDANGDTLTLGVVSAAHGSVVDNGDGTFTVTPDANYNSDLYGPFTVSFEVSDGTLTTTGSATMTVTASPDAPVAGTAALPTATEDTAVTLTTAQLLDDASDPDGDTLSIANLALVNASDGTLTAGGGGTYTFTPAANFSGSVALTYDIDDGTGNLVSTTATLTVSAVNDAPVLSNGGGTFALTAAGTLGSGNLLDALAVDVNGDGLTDLVYVDSTNGLTLAVNQGGEFGSTVFDATVLNSNTGKFDIADINGDGLVDIVQIDSSSTGSSNYFYAYTQNADGSFTLSDTVSLTYNESVTLVDVNNDGKVDAVVARTTGLGNWVYLGNGDGTFNDSTPTSLANATLGAKQALAGDVDGDGDSDLVFVGWGSDAEVWLNNGSGGFTLGSTIDTNGVAVSTDQGSTNDAVLVDLNGDGALDLYLGNRGTEDMAYLNNGDGTFTRTGAYNTSGTSLASSIPVGVAYGDFNNDGKMDVVVANEYADAVMLGNGDGTFTAATGLTSMSIYFDVVAADFDGDGDVDIVGTGTSGAAFYRNDLVSSVSYTAGGTGVAVFSSVTVADVDNASLSGAVVTISGVQDGDSLNFTDQAGITGTYDAATGTLTLTGAATVADYQAALRSITFTTADSLTPKGSRTLSLTVSDGSASSSAVSQFLFIDSMTRTLTASTDRLDGGAGSNTYLVDSANIASDDIIADSGTGGSDVDTLLIQSTGTTDLSQMTVTGIEKLAMAAGGGTVVVGGGVNPQQFASIVGGAGADTIRLRDAATILDLTGISITGVESVSTGAGSDTVLIDDASAPGVSQVVDGDGASGDGDVVVFTQTQAGTLDISAKTFTNIETVRMEAQGSGFAVTLRGNSQGVTFTGGAGNDSLIGGSGADTAIFAGPSTNYAIASTGVTQTVADSAGNSGTDTLSGIETLRFTDRDLTLSRGTASTETLVNATTAQDQTYAQTVALADGGYVVAWQSNLQDGGSWGIYAQVYNADGTVRTAEFLVNVYTTTEQVDVSLAAAPDGGFIASWSDYGQDGQYYGVYARRFDASGTATTGEILVNTTTTMDQTAGNVIALAGGGFLVTFKVDEDYSGVYAQLFDASGNKVSPNEIHVNQYTTQHQTNSDAVQLSNGNIIIVWQSDTQDGDGSRGVYARLMDTSGNFVVNGSGTSDEFALHTITNGIQDSVSVSALSTGFVVVWCSENVDGSGTAIVGRLFDNAGTAAAAEFTINTYTSNDQLVPQVATLANGGFVVTWQTTADGDGTSIAARVYDAAGNAVTGELVINTTTAGNQSNPSVTAMGDGGFLITWQSQNQDDGSTYGIYSQRFSADGTAYSPLTLTATSAADSFTVGLGVDVVDLGAGDDVLKTTAAAIVGGLSVIGGTGNDRLIVTDLANLTGAHLASIGGVETLQLGATTAASQAVALGSEAQTGSIVVVDASTATGTVSIDASSRTSAIDFTTGSAGDSIYGGSGNDVVHSSAGADYFNGGGGTNALDYSDDTAGVTVNLTTGSAIDGWGNTDTLTNFSKVVGSGYDDNLTGGTGTDSLDGGIGNDQLAAGTGTSTLTGGDGNDTFVLNSSGSATVTDFTAGADSFSLSASSFGLSDSNSDTLLDASQYAESTTAMSSSAHDYGGGNSGTGLIAIDAAGGVQLWSTTAMEAATDANSHLVATLTGVDTSSLDNTSFHLAV